MKKLGQCLTNVVLIRMCGLTRWIHSFRINFVVCKSLLLCSWIFSVSSCLLLLMMASCAIAYSQSSKDNLQNNTPVSGTTDLSRTRNEFSGEPLFLQSSVPYFEDSTQSALDLFNTMSTMDNAALGISDLDAQEAKNITNSTLLSLTPNDTQDSIGQDFTTNEEHEASSLPLCQNSTSPQQLNFSCLSPQVSNKCTISHRALASVLTPLGANGNIDYGDFSYRAKQENFKVEFGLGSNDAKKGRCRLFNYTRRFIIDSPQAIKKFFLTNLKYKGYIRLSFSVQNIPLGYYEGLLGTDLNGDAKKYLSSNLNAPSFNKKSVLFTKPNGYLPPIIPLPRKNGREVCIGPGSKTESLNVDIWPNVLSLVPTNFKEAPFMLTLELEVSVVVEGRAQANFEVLYDPSKIMLVNDIASSTECLNQILTLQQNYALDKFVDAVKIACDISYTQQGNTVALGPMEYVKPIASFDLYQGAIIENSEQLVPKVLTSGLSEVVVKKFKSLPSCRLWSVYYTEPTTDLVVPGSMKRIEQNDTNADFVRQEDYPMCADVITNGYRCQNMSANLVVTIDGKTPFILKNYACTLQCRDPNYEQPERSQYMVGTPCKIITKKLVTSAEKQTNTIVPCEEFYDEVTGYSGTCMDLEQDPNCEFINSTCLDDESARQVVLHDGTRILTECSFASKTYQCSKTFELPKGTSYDEVVCDTDTVNCIGTSCTDEQTGLFEKEEDERKGTAIAALGILEYMQNDTICEKGICRIFKGEEHTCRCGLKGNFDCCAIKNQAKAADYVRLTSYIMTLESAAKLIKNEVADFGSWSNIEHLNSSLISSELDSLIGAYSKTGLEATRSNFLEELTNKTADLVEELFGKALRDKLFTTSAQGGISSNTTLHPKVLNSAQGLMQAYIAYKLGEAVYEMVTACHDNEYETSMRIEMDSCHYISSECAHKVLGRCLVRKRHYCCYNSPLAKIVMTGLSAQGFKADSCMGITTEELGRYDLGKIDYSKWFQILQESNSSIRGEDLDLETLTGSGSVLNTKDRADATTRAQGRVQSYISEP